jgi:hypothetical protein
MSFDDTWLWLTTQVMDYAWMCTVALVVSWLFDDTAQQFSSLRRSAACCALGLASVAILHGRERVHIWLLGERLPLCKRVALPHKVHPYLFQTAAASMASYYVMHATGVVYYRPPELSLHFWCSVFAPFYALLALRDVFFLGPLHSRMHTPRWYFLHKLHHEPTKSAQSLHAFYIDLLDLLIE